MEEYFWYNGATNTRSNERIIVIQSSEQKLWFLSGGSSFPGLMFLAQVVHLCQMRFFSNCQIVNGSGNGGYKYTELTGTTHLRAYFDPQDADSQI